jgi:hypothetical protein
MSDEQFERLKSEVSKLEGELVHLMTVKSEKIINEVLQKEHKQLSYLNEYDKEVHLLFGKRAVLLILTNRLSKL